MNRLRANWRLVLVLVLLVGNGLVWFIVAREPRHGQLTVAFLDIGQGDAIYIESPTGNQVLVDGGPVGGPLLARLGEVMPFYDHSIDVVAGTHADADHIGGLTSVLSRYAVGRVMFPGLLAKDTQVYRSFTDAAKKYAKEVTPTRRGQWLELGGGATLTVLWPDPHAPLSDSNDESMVAVLSYGSTAYVLTGDAPQWVERQLVLRGGTEGGPLYSSGGPPSVELRAQVLKAGHHGSKTSSAPEFLAAVHPKYAVISAGRGNRYGHPHEEVLARLAAVGARILRTDDSGTIIIKSNGEDTHTQQ